MKNKYILLSLIFTILSIHLYAQNQTGKDLSKNTLTILENNFLILEFENGIESLNFSDISSVEGNFSRILLGNEYTYSGKAGKPELPVIQRLIEIPLDAEISIQIIDDETITYHLSEMGVQNKLYPIQPSIFKNTQPSPFRMDSVVYSSNKLFSNPLVDVVKLGSLRGTQMARLSVSPVAYNPVQNKLEVHKYLKIQISFKNANLEKTVYEKSRTRSPYHDFSTKLLMNKSNLFTRFDNDLNVPMKYIIVSDPEFRQTLQPFIQWKTQKGFQVIEAYTDDPVVGTTKESIKNYLQQLYNSATPNDPAPVFLLIVGDTPQVPSFRRSSPASGLSAYYTDLDYVEYTGDHFPELFYGRFSARNIEQLENIIDKTMEYEKYEMPNTSYLNNVLLVAGQESAQLAHTTTNGFINYMKSTYFPINPMVDTSFYYNESSYRYKEQILAEVDQGKSFIGYTAHCDKNGWHSPAFSTSQANGLNNFRKYFFSINNCCLSSKFDEPECFGEALLRVADAGAIGVIGASSETIWNEDYYWEVGSKNPVTINPNYNANTLGAFDRFFHTHGEPVAEHYTTQGEMVQAGNMAVSQSGSEYEVYYWEIYNLLGDPSLTPYVGMPGVQHFNVPDSIEKGTTEIRLNGSPFAYIALYKDSVLLGAGLSDENGDATVKVLTPLLTEGYLYVTASKQFYQPYRDSIFVYTPSSPKIIQVSYEFTDSLGNVIQKIQSGQLVNVNMTLRNVGGVLEPNPNTKLENANTEIIKNMHSWPPIDINESVMQQNVFSFRASKGIKDLARVWFNLEISGSDNFLREESIYAVATAPQLSIGDISVDKIRASGPIIINVVAKNVGSLQATNTYCKLTSKSENITFPEDSILPVGTLLPGEERTVSFAANYSPDDDINKWIRLTVYLYSDNQYDDTEKVSIYPESVAETFESGNFSGNSWINNGNAPWTIENAPAHVFKGSYSAKSGKIEDDASSALSITKNVITQDSIRFALKISSEAGYDFLEFYIDNTMVGRWSGTANWKVVSYVVQPGTHTFKWIYKKDFSGSNGYDAAWIDEIILPPSGVDYDISVKPLKTEKLSVLLYPNPAKGEINIDILPVSGEHITIEIYNALGQKMFNKTIPNIAPFQKWSTLLSLSGYAKGTYYAVIYTGREVINRKFIIVK